MKFIYFYILIILESVYLIEGQDENNAFHYVNLIKKEGIVEKHRCGAALLSTKTIITLAVCFMTEMPDTSIDETFKCDDSKMADAKEFSGVMNIDKAHFAIPLNEYIVHEKVNEDCQLYNLAIGRLSREIPKDVDIKPAKLPKGDEISHACVYVENSNETTRKLRRRNLMIAHITNIKPRSSNNELDCIELDMTKMDPDLGGNIICDGCLAALTDSVYKCDPQKNNSRSIIKLWPKIEWIKSTRSKLQNKGSKKSMEINRPIFIFIIFLHKIYNKFINNYKMSPVK